MATFDTSRRAFAFDFGAAASFFSYVASTVTTWNDKRVTRNALSKLSDRELEDIGLARGDILTITR